jgi:hypothetical protein
MRVPPYETTEETPPPSTLLPLGQLACPDRSSPRAIAITSVTYPQPLIPLGPWGPAGPVSPFLVQMTSRIGRRGGRQT